MVCMVCMCVCVCMWVCMCVYVCMCVCKDIGFTFFDSVDVVRHPLVQKIVEAYEAHNDKKNKTRKK